MEMGKGHSLIHAILGLTAPGWGSSDSWKCQGGSGVTSIVVRNVNTIEQSYSQLPELRRECRVRSWKSLNGSHGTFSLKLHGQPSVCRERMRTGLGTMVAEGTA